MVETELDNLNEKSNWGGKREGAGRPEGSLNAETLEKQRVYNEVKQRIMKKAQRILDSQMSLAEGIQFLYRIRKTKIVGPKGGISYKNERAELVTNQSEIQDYIDNLIEKANGELEDENNPEDTYYFITTKEPNNQAIDSMFDRTFDKAGQNIKLDGSLDVKVGELKEIQSMLKNVAGNKNNSEQSI